MDFERTITSEIIDFVVGSGAEQRTYPLHKNFISKQSDTLSTMLSSALENQVFLPDVEPRTFVLFARFAVTGDYNANIDGEVDMQGRDTLDGAVAVATDSKEKLQDKAERYSEPSDADPPLPTFTGDVDADADLYDAPPPYEDTSTSHPLTPSPPPTRPLPPLPTAPVAPGNTLLRHAKVYTFAEKYAIPPLVEKSLSSIRGLLHDIVDDVQDVRQLVELIKYSYSNTPDDPNEKLRVVLVEFCADNIRFLKSFTEFKELQCEGGSFSVDLTEGIVSYYDGKMQCVEDRVLADLQKGLRELEELRGEPVPTAYWQIISRVRR